MRALRVLTALGLLLGASIAHAQPVSPAPAPPVAPPPQPAAPDMAQAPDAPPAPDVTAPGTPTDPAAPPIDAAPPTMIDPAAAAAEAPASYEESFDPALAAMGEGQLSAEELAKLGFGGEEGEAAVDTDIKVFGFADFSLSAAAMKKSNAWRSFVGRHSTMYVGNFNLFLSKALSQNVRTMGEVRFHYAPHGSSLQDGSFNVSSGEDHANFYRPVTWGGVEIERIYIEWSMIPNLAIRAGQFLTPYGIWNVDHGSPLFIPVQRPYAIGSNLFPERQTGLELFGKWDASANNAIGYHLTLSNGMGPISEIRDLDDNKAVGGRFYWELRKLGLFRLGASGFYGTDTTARNVQGLDATGMLTAAEQITQQSRVLAIAGDVQWKFKGLHLQAEVVTQQRRYTSAGRVGVPSPLLGGQPLFNADTFSWGTYGIAGYRFEWLGVMPYVMVQAFRQLELTNLNTKTRGFTAGLNIRALDAVVLKVEYIFSVFPDGSLISDDNIQLVQAQVAWAF